MAFGEASVQDVVLEWLQRFLFVMVLTIPFEIRDMAVDNLSLGTIPQKIGIKNARKLGIYVLVVVFALELLKQNWLGTDAMTLLVVIVLLVLALIYSRVKQHRYYCSFWWKASR